LLVEVEVEEGEEGVVPPELPEVPAVVVVAATVALEDDPAEVGPGAPVMLTQEVDDPEMTVTGAVCATRPLLSRRVNPMYELGAMLHVHVKEVLLLGEKLSRGEPLGELPGRTLKK